MTPHDIFNARHYTGVRKPLLSADQMPGWCYTDAAFYRREVERLFMTGTWHLVGRADAVPNPGDFFVAELVGVSTIVVRDAAGEIRAFANLCRHRGAPLAEGSGTCSTFKCPYHGWSFATDGRLRGAPGMNRAEDFDPAAYGLIPVRLEMWGGFAFICFDAEAPDLMTFLGDMPERIASHEPETMVGVRTQTHVLDCNWKLWVENFMEPFHIPTVHKRSISLQEVENTPEETDGSYLSIYEKHVGTRALIKGDPGFPPIPTLTGKAAEGTRFILIYPAAMLAVTTDTIWSMQCQPLGPDKTRLIVTQCFPKATLERDDYQALVPNYFKRIDISIPEDNDIAMLQHKGIASPLYKPGRFSHLEPLVHTIGNWVLDRVLDPEPQAAAAAE